MIAVAVCPPCYGTPQLFARLPVSRHPFFFIFRSSLRLINATITARRPWRCSWPQESGLLAHACCGTRDAQASQCAYVRISPRHPGCKSVHANTCRISIAYCIWVANEIEMKILTENSSYSTWLPAILTYSGSETFWYFRRLRSHVYVVNYRKLPYHPCAFSCFSHRATVTTFSFTVPFWTVGFLI